MRKPSSETAILLVLSAIQFTHVMDFMIIMPLGPQLMRLFDVTPSQFGLIVSSYTFAGGLFGFLGAFFIDRFDRKKALLIAYLGFIAGTFACALAPDYKALIATRFLTGSFGGLLGSLVLSVVGDLIPMERRATAMGKVMMGFSLASVLGVPFGLYLANLISWHASFVFLGCLSLVVVAGIIRYLPAMSDHMTNAAPDANSLKTFVGILSDRNHITALSVMVTLMFSQFCIVPFISPYMVANVGLEEGDLPLIYLFGGLATMVALPWTGRLADRFGRLKIFNVFTILTLFVVIALTNLPAAPVYVALIVTTFYFIAVSSRGVSATTMITTAVVPAQRGRFMSLNASAQQISAGLASWLAGFIITKNSSGELMYYNVLGWGAVVFGLICLVLARQIKARS